MEFIFSIFHTNLSDSMYPSLLLCVSTQTPIQNMQCVILPVTLV